jgi:hypothetical protein
MGAPSEDATRERRRLAGLHPLVPPIVAIIVIIVLGIIAHFTCRRLFGNGFHSSKMIVHFCPAVKRDASILSNVSPGKHLPPVGVLFGGFRLAVSAAALRNKQAAPLMKPKPC